MHQEPDPTRGSSPWPCTFAIRTRASSRDRHTVVMRLAGLSDSQQLRIVAAAIRDCIDEGSPRVVIEVTGKWSEEVAKELPSRLVAPAVDALEAGGGLALVGAPEALRREMQQFGLDPWVPTCPDESSALSRLRCRPSR